MNTARLLGRLIVVAVLAGCASPALTLYTLGQTAADPDATRPARPLGARPTVIELARVTVPDEIDTEEIFVREGSILRRSSLGRWASRLSLGVTDRLTARLAERRPDALVTDRAQTEAPAYRILINISRLDVTTAGVTTLEADWIIVPHNPALPTRRDRARFVTNGPVTTNQDVVVRIGQVLDQLAGAINMPK